MAVIHNIPKGGKSVKYANKKKPLTPSRKYKRLLILVSLILIGENIYLFNEDIVEIICQIDLKDLSESMKDIAQRYIEIAKAYLR